MDSILNFDAPFDVRAFEQVVDTFSKLGPKQTEAQRILYQFSEMPLAYQRVRLILEQSTLPAAKILALQVLEKLVASRWNAISRTEAEAIKSYMVSSILNLAGNPSSLKEHYHVLAKCNVVLVEILKHEWPAQWPNFVQEIIQSSYSNPSLCENNLKILKLLTEDIFVFGNEELTQSRKRKLSAQLTQEFSSIFSLCVSVLSETENSALAQSALELTKNFVAYIPEKVVFESSLVAIITSRFLLHKSSRTLTIGVLTEVTSLDTSSSYSPAIQGIFAAVLDAVNTVYPIANLSANHIQNLWSSTEDEFIRTLAIFLSNVYINHAKTIEAMNNPDLLNMGLRYLLRISEIDEPQLFRICLDYWSKLVQELYHENPMFQNRAAQVNSYPLLLNTGAPDRAQVAAAQMRHDLYSQALSELRKVMIKRMVKPEEVLVVENEDGEIVREVLKDSETIQLYRAMKDVLVYLTHLNQDDTVDIMSRMLDAQILGPEWDIDIPAKVAWNQLNTLCWAIGSISGAMAVDAEKRFLVTVIRELLNMCEMKRGKHNKAVVASNIMYIVGQYPRFLKTHWKFLQTVVRKLFEFMHETHEGVQDMACDTFIKIAIKCRRHFVLRHDERPFIEDIIEKIGETIKLLQQQQIHTFYEACGYLVGAEVDRARQEQLIVSLFAMPNTAWITAIARVHANCEAILSDANETKLLTHVLKTNSAVCRSLGHPYYIQLGQIFQSLLQLYQMSSAMITKFFQTEGPTGLLHFNVKSLRTMKKEILRLFETYIPKSDDQQLVCSQIVPPLLEATLEDYARSPPDTRDSEVLSLCCVIITKFESAITPLVKPILSSVLESTVSMISNDLASSPDHRTHLYNLLSVIVKKNFIAVTAFDAQMFNLLTHCTKWGMKHLKRDIADTAHMILQDLLVEFAGSSPDIANGFFRTYLLQFFEAVFAVLTDMEHKSSFKMQCTNLATMIDIVVNKVQAPLFDVTQVQDPTMNNAKYLQSLITNWLVTAFAQLSLPNIHIFVQGLFHLHLSLPQFKAHVRDFLIAVKSIAGDTTDLFLEEKEMEMEIRKQQLREIARSIPGMLKPMELEDDDQED